MGNDGMGLLMLLEVQKRMNKIQMAECPPHRIDHQITSHGIVVDVLWTGEEGISVTIKEYPGKEQFLKLMDLLTVSDTRVLAAMIVDDCEAVSKLADFRIRQLIEYRSPERGRNPSLIMDYGEHL
jgi:hypothetical protein